MSKQMNLAATKPCPIKPYTTRELADLYEISSRLFLKWIRPFKKRIGKRNGWLYNVLQVERIFAVLGRPEVNEAD